MTYNFFQKNNFMLSANNEFDSCLASERSILRNAFGNYAQPGLIGSPLILSSRRLTPLTPFRAAFNAGDINGTVNTAANSRYGIISNQVNGLTSNLNPTINAAGKGGLSTYVGHSKYVYDSSDYTRFKKLNTGNRILLNDRNLRV